MKERIFNAYIKPILSSLNLLKKEGAPNRTYYDEAILKCRLSYRLKLMEAYTKLGLLLNIPDRSKQLDWLYELFGRKVNKPKVTQQKPKLGWRQKKPRFHPYAYLHQIVKTMSSTEQEYNSDLWLYDLKVKIKSGESELFKTGSKRTAEQERSLYKVESRKYGIIRHKSEDLSKKGNLYLSKSYRYLAKQLESGNYLRYITHVFFLLQNSLSFKIAHYSSWNKRWYKESKGSANMVKVIKWTSLFIKNWRWFLTRKHQRLTNFWVESPKGKWRQLCIPTVEMRYLSHILNKILQHILRKQLPAKSFHGFIYDRGCLSSWRSLIVDKLWEYDNIYQIDVSSGFPNLNLLTVKESLEYLKLPENFVTLILEILILPQKAGKKYPTETAKWEGENNDLWRQGPRNVPMGLGISPIIYTWVTYYLINHKLKLINGIKWINYADDLNLFFSKSFYYMVNRLSTEKYMTLSEMQTNFLSQLNNIPELIFAGLQFDVAKNRKVKENGKWFTDIKLLGLRLDENLNLYGCTRGRGESPKRQSTEASNVLLKRRLNLFIEQILKDGNFTKWKLFTNLNNFHELDKILMECIRVKPLEYLNFKWIQEHPEYLGVAQALLYNHGELYVDDDKYTLEYDGLDLISKLKSANRLPKGTGLQNGKYHAELFAQTLLKDILKKEKSRNILLESWNINERLKLKLKQKEWINVKSDYFKKYIKPVDR
jgi:hypothetical protein